MADRPIRMNRDGRTTVALDATALREMETGELDSTTGLQTRSDKGWQDIVTGVRDEVLEANDHDRWDVKRRRDEVIHELADSLVPANTSELMREFTIIGAAWGIEPSDADIYLAMYDQWANVVAGATDMESMVRRALYLAYRAAVLALVETLEEADDDEEDDEEA